MEGVRHMIMLGNSTGSGKGIAAVRRDGALQTRRAMGRFWG